MRYFIARWILPNGVHGEFHVFALNTYTHGKREQKVVQDVNCLELRDTVFHEMERLKVQIHTNVLYFK